ncbi:hypothetical protein [Achromobacter kerstersii]|uniref:hypothetical protein n=1 Tax=Achromobacter kerstersii TaxID=1353890 RepID=UPI001581A12B|nr:hypothetical protein [Achromobacter kerstersii]
MNVGASMLFRAHSKKYLSGINGIIANPNLQRARQPRDTPVAVHEVLKGWFEDRFGVDYRGSSLFCTGDVAIAAGYKTQASVIIAIEPIGNYSLCYSTKCKDLFAYYQFYWRITDASPDKMRADMDLLGFIHHHNDGLEAAAASGNEVMLVAEKFRYSLR